MFISESLDWFFIQKCWSLRTHLTPSSSKTSVPLGNIESERGEPSHTARPGQNKHIYVLTEMLWKLIYLHIMKDCRDPQCNHKDRILLLRAESLLVDTQSNEYSIIRGTQENPIFSHVYFKLFPREINVSSYNNVNVSHLLTCLHVHNCMEDTAFISGGTLPPYKMLCWYQFQPSLLRRRLSQEPWPPCTEVAWLCTALCNLFPPVFTHISARTLTPASL